MRDLPYVLVGLALAGLALAHPSVLSSLLMWLAIIIGGYPLVASEYRGR